MAKWGEMTANSDSKAWVEEKSCPTCKDGICQCNEPPPADIKQQLVDEAMRIVEGARRSAYGSPEDNFARIALFWGAYFKNTGRDIELTAKDVSPMMRLMKEARLCKTPDHADSLVDLIGYALTGAEVNGIDKLK